MVGHPVQSFFQLWWDTLYNPSATSMTRNLGFESLPFQKKNNTFHIPTYSLCLAFFCVLNFGGTPCTRGVCIVLHAHPSLLLNKFSILNSTTTYM